MDDLYNRIFKHITTEIEKTYKFEIKEEIKLNFKKAIEEVENKDMKELFNELVKLYEKFLIGIQIMPGFNDQDLNNLIMNSFAIVFRYIKDKK